jgi:hypothetical protein
MKTKQDFKDGKIIGVYNKNNKLIYIASTIMRIDKYLKIKVYKRIKSVPPLLTMPLASYAYQNEMGKGWTIKLLEDYPCDQRWKMMARVQQLVQIYKPIVNMHLKSFLNFTKLEKKGKKVKVQCPCCASSTEDSEDDCSESAEVITIYK